MQAKFTTVHMRYGLLLIGFILSFLSNELFAQPLSGIQPKNGAFIQETQAEFHWNSLPNAINYTVMIATDPGFSLNLQQSPALNTTVWVSGALNSGIWYWKVVGFDGIQNTESVVSNFRIFQPNNLSGNTLWLAADSNLTMNGGNVASWNDISGNGHVFTQATAVDQPLLINSLPALNNQPVLKFDGASDFLNGGNILNIGTNSLTTFVLTNGTGVYYAKFGNPTAPHNLYSLYNIGTLTHELAGSGFQSFSASLVNNYSIVSFKANRSTNFGTLYKNLIQVTNASITGISSPAYNFTISNPLLIGRYALTGSPYYLNGDLAEVIFYNVALTDPERQMVENHLIYKYAPPIDLGKDTLLANFCPHTLTPTSGFTNYSWSTGETTASINVTQAGTYWVQATNIFGVVSRDTVVVYHPTIPTPTFTGICVNEFMIWDADMGPGFTYLWSPNGETTPSISINAAGTYSVQVTDASLCTKTSDLYTFGIDTYSQTTFLGNDTTLCSGNLIALQVGAAETVSYTWPAATPPTQTNYAVDTTGNYFVEAVNANGCEAQDTMYVTISGTAPIADFDFQNACLNTVNNFTDQSVPIGVDNIAIWSWDLGDGSPVQTTQNVNYTYAASGTYDVELYVESIGGCGAYHTETVQVFANPTANFTKTGHCEDQAVQFTNTSTAGAAAITDYLWDFDMPWTGAYNTSNIPVPNRIFDIAGTYAVSFLVTDANNCVDSIEINVVVDPTPQADFSAADACVNVPINFTNTSVTQPFSTYFWDFGDATSSILTNPSKSFPTAGIKTVALSVTNSFGCVGTVQYPVEIFSNPVVAMDLGPYCMGTYMETTDISTVAGGTIDSSIWVFNTQDSLIGASVDYLIGSMGQQMIGLTTFSNHGCFSTTNQFIDVTTELNASFTAGGGIAAAGAPFSFTNTSTANSLALWNFGDGSLSSDFSPMHTYSSSYIDSTMDVYLIALNMQGCVDTAFQTIAIQQAKIDLELTALYLQKQADWYIVGVKMTNRGSVDLASANLTIETSNGLLFNETWNGTLSPLEDSIYVFTAQPGSLISEHDGVDAFVCVKGIGYDANAVAETYLDNNKVCKNIEGKNVILLPIYPNPVLEEMHVQLIVSADSEVTVTLFDLRGRAVKEIVPQQTLATGLYDYTINMSQIQAGAYYVRMKSGDLEVMEKVVVGN